MTCFKLALKNTKIYQHTAPRVPKPGLTIKVEQKFKPSLPRFRNNDGIPPFSSHNHLGCKVLKEVYFETGDVDLMRERTYIRARNGVLEAKVQHAGDWTHSVSKEIIGQKAVKKHLASVFPRTKIKLDELSPFGWMRTLRDEWKVDEFNVAFDRTLFGAWMWGKVDYPQRPHLVGKVELCQNVKQTDREEVAKEMDQSIKAFMEQYEWAFPKDVEKPKGKLTVFDEWMKALIDKRWEAMTDDERSL